MATYQEPYRQHPLPPAPHHTQFQEQQQQQSRYRQQNEQQNEQENYPPPSQQQRPLPRDAKQRTFSFHSQKSHKSSGSKDLTETSAEKEARRLHSKADPTLAINEAEPSVVAMMSAVSMSPLRAMQHKDSSGNTIADPDKSNPTRNRWERPLDTIRSFEAAIDGGYSRKSIIRTDGDSVVNFNRRNSYHPSNQPRFPQDTYYNNRPVSFRPENTKFESGPQRQGYFDGQVYNSSYGAGPSRARISRIQSEPHHAPYGRDQHVYPLPHKDRSYETVTSAAGSGHSDHNNGYQTDPTSSDNSSIDRTSPAKRSKPINDYGIGFSQSPSYQPQMLGSDNGAPGRKPLPQSVAQPPAPAMLPSGPPGTQKPMNTLLRRKSTQQSTSLSTPPRPEPEKRKSWLSRRFSKRS